jgi:hypothetical protein
LANRIAANPVSVLNSFPLITLHWARCGVAAVGLGGAHTAAMAQDYLSTEDGEAWAASASVAQVRR